MPKTTVLLLACVFSATAATGPIRVYADKAAFLAATGATSATGPLPNLGCVAAGGVGSATVGSVTFRVGPGGGDLCIGAPAVPDWYPPTPGHDIAQGVESLEVQTATPVFSLGFDFVEPRTTMPPWGGTPVNSVFQVTLYNGATNVGQFTFDAPDDVIAFAGVHSTVAFNRVVIIDSTGTADDEYWGQFYTGTTPAPTGSGPLYTYTDKAAFQAATGATSATGPLPNLGCVAAGGVGSATVGSVTFSVGPGGGDLCIGAAAVPDWYLPTPGHDIAQGVEILQVDTAAPVFSLGFDFVEPRTTMPPWGGTPVNSMYQVTLYNGVMQVGQFNFDAPDDVLAFVGVHSTQAFNRVVICDTTGNNDDEYWGQFYTGTTPAAPPVFISAARTGGAIPGGTGVFTGFPRGPAISAGNLAFFGVGGGGQQGIYRTVTPGAVPIRVADLFTPIPNGAGNFTGFGAFAAGSAQTAFIGTGAGQAGVYRCLNATPVDPCRPLADLATAIPRGTGNFTGFSRLAGSGSITAFLGLGAGQAGVYSCDTATPVDPCRPLADLATAIPGGTGTFSGFSDIATSGTITRFVGTGLGQAGVYRCDSAIPTDPCRPIAALTTAIPGGSGTFTGFSHLAASGLISSFVGTGLGQAGVYRCDSAIPTEPCSRVADLSTAIPGGVGAFTGFSAVSTSAGHVAFLGQGSGGQAGIYLASVLSKVVAVGDTLDGKSVTALRLGPSGLDGLLLTFAATFADGSEGVFTTTVQRASPAVTPFASFQPSAAIDLRHNAFAAGAIFTLAASSNGIAPLTESLRLQVGSFSTTLPPGSFRSNGFGFIHRGASLILTLQPLGNRRYVFGALGWNANLAGTANPVTVELAIGDDAGSKAITAYFGFVPH